MRKVVVISLWLCANLLFAQQYTETRNSTPIKEREKADESVVSIKAYGDNLDSIKYIISDWASVCALSEPIFRISVLYDIARNADVDKNISEENFKFIINYIYRKNLINKDSASIAAEYELNEEYYGYVDLGGDFDDFTESFAGQLVKRTDLNSIDSLFLALYTNKTDEFLTKLKSESVNETNVRKQYEEEIKTIKKMPNGNISLGLGLWIPNGDLGFLGPHPSVSLQLGVHGRYLLGNLDLRCRFLEAADEYYIDVTNQNLDTTFSTRHFSIYLGFQPGVTFVNTKRHEVSLVGGVGLDIFKAFSANDYDESVAEKDRFPVTFTAANFNAGLAYRYKTKKNSYIGIYARYEFLTYENPRGSSLDGDALSISVSFGILENSVRKQNLKFWKVE